MHWEWGHLSSEARPLTPRSKHHGVNAPELGHCPNVERTITKAWLRKDSGSPSLPGPCIQLQRDPCTWLEVIPAFCSPPKFGR